jgi:hypothetical protein
VICVRFKNVLMILGVASIALAAGCANSSIFGFPSDQGDIAAGRQAFIDHRCHQCHSITGEQLPTLAGADRPILELGGPTSIVRSYAELTTSIINPNHAISERYRNQELLKGNLPLASPMPRPNLDTMTVRQLLDLVTFLDSKYELLIEDYE